MYHEPYPLRIADFGLQKWCLGGGYGFVVQTTKKSCPQSAARNLRTTNRQILVRLERKCIRVFLGPHASSVHEVSQVHARCVRSQEASLPLCFLGSGVFGCVCAAL